MHTYEFYQSFSGCNLDSIQTLNKQQRQIYPERTQNPPNLVSILFVHLDMAKAELPQEGIFFRTQFSSLGIFIFKKVGNQKN